MARRHSTAQRTKATALDEDVFVERTLALSGWAQQNRKTISIGMIVLAVALVGGIYYWNYRKTHGERAAVELERVQQAVAFGDTATAKIELGQYIENFGSTPYADEARLLLGQMYLQSNQPDQAAQVLDKASDTSTPLGRQAATLLAKTREQQGQLDEAERLLLQVADKSDLDFQKKESLEEAARIRQRRGNLAGAVELYQRIVDGIEETDPSRAVYEMRLEELKAQQTKS